MEYSDNESSTDNSENSDESEIIRPSYKRQRTLINEIKENTDLYATRRSDRNRKELFRYNDLSDESSQHSKSDNKEDDSDYEYVKKRKKYAYEPKMEIRKRVRVSYKEALTSDDNVSDDLSDDNGEPKKKSNKVNELIKKDNGFKLRDNPLLNKPNQLIRISSIDQKPIIEDAYENSITIDNQFEDINVIEEIINIRLGYCGDTGIRTAFYNQQLKENISYNSNSQERERHYLIKWRGWSYIHSTWESEESLLNYPKLDGIKKFYKYKEAQNQHEKWKEYYASPEDLDAAQFEEERNETLLMQKMQCERIIDAQRNKYLDSIDYLVKWKTLDYRYATWECGKRIMDKLYPEAIKEFDERSRSDKIPNKKCEALSRRPKFIPIREQPDYLFTNSELILRDYQLDGLNWLARSWTRGNSVILADEMGLGKTIQTVSFLSHLFNEYSIHGPFLIVVPLSTISGWQAEFANWAPYMNVVYYTGDAVSRQVIRECEWYFPNKKLLKFHVCVTTFELVLKDKMWLNQISWAFLGIDEAHRLKNDESQLYQALITFDTNTRLLITGTPVHNSLKELWALLHFIMPDKFDKWTHFDEKYNLSNDNGAVSEIINDLYKELEPFLLRRIKKDVEKSLPSKSEQIIRIPMCRKQADLYKLILTKNYEALSKETRGHTSSFLNVVMELKKCCNHIQLINPLDENTEQNMDLESRLRYFIKGSGKMMLLDKLLFELKDKGHRVLIFSQMVRMLDIISDYLVLRGWGFQRLDGSINGSLRKQAIDHFNSNGSTDFCFLLSTRAGGLGINLATADTVIIFDSDWNPQNDMQAMARAHRIGQKRQVSVYRFVIKSSVEEKIIECAKRKMVLDHLVIQRMDSVLRPKAGADKNQPFNKDELNEILKFGAADLFNQDEQLDEEQELNIHDILQRAESRDNDEENHNPANELLSAFKVVNITETTEDEDVVYIGPKGKQRLWSEIVPEEIRDKVKEEEIKKAFLELGPRQRKILKVYPVGQNDSASEDSVEEFNKGLHYKLKYTEIKAVLRVMRKFPKPLERVKSIILEAEIIDRNEKDVYDLMKHIIDGCHKVINKCDSDEKRNKVSFNIGKVVIPAQSLLTSIEYLDILHNALPKNKEERIKFQLPFETKLANWSCDWETKDDARLLVGIYEKGLDNWEAIKMDTNLKLTTKILPSSLTEKPQSTHLKTRVDYLLKKLKDSKLNNFEASNRGSKKPNKTKTVAVSNPKSVETSHFIDPRESINYRTKAKSNTKSNKIIDKVKSKSDFDVSNLKTEEEEQFYEMSGVLFDKCTKKMKVIKEQLKYLEDKQRKFNGKIKDDDKSLINCLLSVGNHIRSVIDNFDNDDDKRKWRNYLWSFVNFFFDVFPKEQLHRIYKNAYKKSAETKKIKSDLSRNDDKDVSLIKSARESSDRANVEAKSYHEYKLKMKRLKGETSENNSYKTEKCKPYNKLPNKRDDFNNEKSTTRKSEHEPKINRVNESHCGSHVNEPLDNISLKAKNNRDPRLSKRYD